MEKSRPTLDEAVRLHMSADVRVGCYLSGERDSRPVLGLAARHAREPIHGFTLTFLQVAYDEGKTPTERFHELLQDTLRAPELSSLPF